MPVFALKALHSALNLPSIIIVRFPHERVEAQERTLPRIRQSISRAGLTWPSGSVGCITWDQFLQSNRNSREERWARELKSMHTPSRSGKDSIGPIWVVCPILAQDSIDQIWVMCPTLAQSINELSSFIVWASPPLVGPSPPRLGRKKVDIREWKLGKESGTLITRSTDLLWTLLCRLSEESVSNSRAFLGCGARSQLFYSLVPISRPVVSFVILVRTQGALSPPQLTLVVHLVLTSFRFSDFLVAFGSILKGIEEKETVFWASGFNQESILGFPNNPLCRLVVGGARGKQRRQKGRNLLFSALYLRHVRFHLNKKSL